MLDTICELPCGCVCRWGGFSDGYSIYHCPLHKSAQILLHALEYVRDHAKDDSPQMWRMVDDAIAAARQISTPSCLPPPPA